MNTVFVNVGTQTQMSAQNVSIENKSRLNISAGQNMSDHLSNLGLLGSPLWHKNCSAESTPPSSNVTTGTVAFNTPVRESNINNE